MFQYGPVFRPDVGRRLDIPRLVCRRTSSLIMTSVIASLMPRDITAATAAAATQLSYPMVVAMVVGCQHASGFHGNFAAYALLVMRRLLNRPFDQISTQEAVV